ncbi:AraC family transcriptional regulator [Paludibacterium yongneupense]|uniref:AraC family transcriptional regulator n=1 Tax=Paludibacterium yongneupense TaxID=400061 RepID=UPI000424C6D5|nr:AraC family transcriptional regulator [Paludibacterium yongneupense]
MTQQFSRDPELPFFESRRAWRSRACYRPHTHPTLSIGAVDAGASTLVVEGAAPVRLAAGDVVLIAPQRVHSCNPEPDEEWSYQMLYLDPDWVETLLREIHDGEPGRQAVFPAWQRSPALYRGLTRLTDALHSPLDNEHKESLLVDFVGGLLTRASTAVAAPGRPEWLSATLHCLDLQCERVWPLERLAAAAGLSRYHFIRAFRSSTGMTPHAFQLDCRINRARAGLRTGAGLAELALALGFADQSHFQHAFKQRVAVTPFQYRDLSRG